MNPHMQNNPEEFVATLVHPDEYLNHLNQVASLTTRNIRFIKRKFASRAGCELVEFPLSDCVCIAYKDERPLFKLVSGVLLVLLISFISYMVIIYWDRLAKSTELSKGFRRLCARCREAVQGLARQVPQ